MGFDITQFALMCVVFVAMIAAITGIGVATHAYLRRARRAAVASLPLDDRRLAHLEQAMDAIAVEIERISEGQRYLVKLRSERGQDRSLAP